MAYVKIIVTFWIIGWLIIGIPYVWLTSFTFSELFQHFLFCTVFFGGIFAFSEGRAYIKERANKE